MPMTRNSKRGFASMDSEQQRKIASMGGKAVKGENRSFSKDRNLAAVAGSEGGKSVASEKRSFSTNRALAAEAGRKGGLAKKHWECKLSISGKHSWTTITTDNAWTTPYEACGFCGVHKKEKQEQ